MIRHRASASARRQKAGAARSVTPSEEGDVESTRQNQLVIASRALVRELDDIWGHVSCRTLSGDGFFLKNLRRPDTGFDPDEILMFDLDGRQTRGRQEPPVELPIHTAIYRRRTDVMSVVHAHPPVAVALSAAERTVYAISQEGYEFGDGIPLIGGDLVVDSRLADRLVSSLGQGVAILLRGHGGVTVGPSVPHATVTMVALERTARQLVWASSIGRPAPLPPGVMQSFAAQRRDDEPPLWRHLEALEGLSRSGA